MASILGRLLPTRKVQLATLEDGRRDSEECGSDNLLLFAKETKPIGITKVGTIHWQKNVLFCQCHYVGVSYCNLEHSVTEAE